MRLTALWASLLIVGMALLLGPVTAFADERGWHKPKPPKDSDAATVYEVAEWGMFTGSNPPHRQAMSTLVGTVEAGVTICPKKLKVPFCALVILASDDINLADGSGPVQGEFWVVTQLDNNVDGPEGIILVGKLLDGTINLSPVIFENVPLGSLSGRWEAEGTAGGPLAGWSTHGEVQGTFRLPFTKPPFKVPLYLTNPDDLGHGCCRPVLPREFSLGDPTVLLELSLTLAK